MLESPLIRQQWKGFMIIVTGGAGMIGSRIIKSLNAMGRRDILVVDCLEDGKKFNNLTGSHIQDFKDKDLFRTNLLTGKLSGDIEVIFHQGACTDTTEWNGKRMMDNNYQYSQELLHFCHEHNTAFIYASSAAVYGCREGNFTEDAEQEQPLNVYGYTKYQFDQYVRYHLSKHANNATAPVCGLRYFNVYGPHEQHKGPMASVAFHMHQQIQRGERPKLFVGSEDFRRDFIHVDDVVALNLWCWQQCISGIFNCGTGYAESFQTVADAVVEYHHHQVSIERIPFPDELKGHYQTYTQADLTRLRAAGYDKPFIAVAKGVQAYMGWLHHL